MAAHQPSQRQERRERHALLARRGSFASDHRQPHHGTRTERDQQRGSHGRAQVEPHHPRQLHVAHAHPGGMHERGHQQEGERGRAGDQELGQLVGANGHRGAEAPKCRRQENLVGHDPVVQVDAGHRHEHRRERQQGDQVGVPAPGEDHRRERGRGDQLHQRVPRRDPLAAAAAAPPQGQPRQQRHVVERPDLRLTARAARPRLGQGLPQRQPVDHHVQKAADGRAQRHGEDGEGGGLAGHVRGCSGAARARCSARAPPCRSWPAS